MWGIMKKTKIKLTTLFITLIVILLIGCNISYNHYIQIQSLLSINHNLSHNEFVEGKQNTINTSFNKLDNNYFIKNNSYCNVSNSNLLENYSNEYEYVFSGNEEMLTGANAIARASKSVVEVSSIFNGQKQVGSGVIIAKSKKDNARYIVTNYHVVQGGTNFAIRFYDGQTINNAQLVGYNKDEDVAVLMYDNGKIDGKNIPLVIIRNTINEPISLAEDAYAVGNPLGQLGGTLTKGIISSLERKIVLNGTELTCIQTDASINSGNSGGGLFDCQGRLIGIVNAKVSAMGVEGLGFALPIYRVVAICKELIATHEYDSETMKVTARGSLLGDAELGFDIKYTYFLNNNFDLKKGFYITMLDVNSNAYSAGLRMYDKVVEIYYNDHLVALDTNFAFSSIVKNCKSGDKISMIIYRENELDNININFKL